MHLYSAAEFSENQQFQLGAGDRSCVQTNLQALMWCHWWPLRPGQTCGFGTWTVEVIVQDLFCGFVYVHHHYCNGAASNGTSSLL